MASIDHKIQTKRHKYLAKLCNLKKNVFWIKINNKQNKQLEIWNMFSIVQLFPYKTP